MLSQSEVRTGLMRTFAVLGLCLCPLTVIWSVDSLADETFSSNTYFTATVREPHCCSWGFFNIAHTGDDDVVSADIYCAVLKKWIYSTFLIKGNAPLCWAAFNTLIQFNICLPNVRKTFALLFTQENGEVCANCSFLLKLLWKNINLQVPCAATYSHTIAEFCSKLTVFFINACK